jgi:hypothetical protein
LFPVSSVVLIIGEKPHQPRLAHVTQFFLTSGHPPVVGKIKTLPIHPVHSFLKNLRELEEIEIYFAFFILTLCELLNCFLAEFDDIEPA